MFFLKKNFKTIFILCIIFFNIKSNENKKLIFGLVSFLVGYKVEKIRNSLNNFYPIIILYGGYEINNFLKNKSYKNFILKFLEIELKNFLKERYLKLKDNIAKKIDDFL